VNPERLICGLATVFDAPSANGGGYWQAHHFADFVKSCMAVKMLDSHRPPIGDDEVLGSWRAFAVVEAGSTPAGLLTIGEFGHSAYGQARLNELSASNAPWGDPKPWEAWGLSVTAGDVSEAGDGTRRWLTEVSLTTKPAYADARVLGVGPYAGDVWRLLTGTEPPRVVVPTTHTVRRLLGATDRGKPIYDDGGV